MFEICTLNKIAPKGLACFSQDIYKITDDINSASGVLVRSAKMHDLIFNPSLQVVGRAGVGVNNIPIEKLSLMGIPVMNAPGANANAVKELVIAGLLLASRNILPAWQFVQDLKGDNASLNQQVEQGKKQFVGTELPGKTLGVIGLGAIGVKVANVALSLGMNVVGYDPALTVNRARELSPSVNYVDQLDQLLKQCDFVTVHVPLNTATEGLLNDEAFAKLKPGAVVLNFARQSIIDEASLVKAIDSNIVRHYVCDFPSEELREKQQVVVLPHLGASTQEAEENCALMAAQQVKDYLENGNIINSVNFPDIVMPKSTAVRIAIANSNVPNMVAQISSCLGAAGLNIIDMLNKSRGDLAYTLLDVDSDVNDSVLESLRRIDGVLRVRLIR